MIIYIVFFRNLNVFFISYFQTNYRTEYHAR